MVNRTHYYGDLIRKLFVAGGALMLVSLPFLQTFIPVPLFVSILAILVVTLCAGIIAPTQKWVLVANTLVAAGSVAVFEHYAITSYMDNNTSFFMVNQILAILFLVAFYYGVKSVRGVFLEKDTDQ